MSTSGTMIRAWIDAVLVPAAREWAKSGLPLSQLGGILLGYGVRISREGGVSDLDIRKTVEAALTGSPAATPT